MSKTKKIFVPPTLIPEMADDEVDEFFSLNDAHIAGTSTDKIIKSFINKDYAEQTVDLSHEVLTKILLGDKSDHIPKITNISPAKAAKIIESLQSKFGESLISLLDDLNEEFILTVLEEVSIVNKLKDLDKIKELRDHLLFNIKIIRLTTKVFPDEIQDVLVSFFNEYQPLKFHAKEFVALKNNLSTL